MAGSHKGVDYMKEDGEIDLESEEGSEFDNPIANMSTNFIHAKSSAIRLLGE